MIIAIMRRDGKVQGIGFLDVFEGEEYFKECIQAGVGEIPIHSDIFTPRKELEKLGYRFSQREIY